MGFDLTLAGRARSGYATWNWPWRLDDQDQQRYGGEMPESPSCRDLMLRRAGGLHSSTGGGWRVPGAEPLARVRRQRFETPAQPGGEDPDAGHGGYAKDDRMRLYH